jgi:cytochrome P450
MSADTTLSSQDRNLTRPTCFATGGHFCLGALIARRQLRHIMRAFLDRAARIELTGPVRRVAFHPFPGFKSMPVRVTPFSTAANRI